MAVADAWRGQRLGHQLLAAAIASARRRGIVALEATMLTGNHPIHALLEHSGLPWTCHAVEPGVESIRLELSRDPHGGRLNRGAVQHGRAPSVPRALPRTCHQVAAGQASARTRPRPGTGRPTGARRAASPRGRPPTPPPTPRAPSVPLPPVPPSLRGRSCVRRRSVTMAAWPGPSRRMALVRQDQPGSGLLRARCGTLLPAPVAPVKQEWRWLPCV